MSNMKGNSLTKSGLIPASADFKSVAESIVSNIESWRVDSQAKTDATVARMVANINAKEKERLDYSAQQKESAKLDCTNYGYGRNNGRNTGD